MLKALEILKELESYPLGFCHFKKEILKEAIAELEALKDKKYDVYQSDRFTPAVKIASFETKLEAENYRDKAENESIKYDAYTCFYIEEVER